MPGLNTNFRFSEKKATTVPVVKIPRKVKDALCIRKKRSRRRHGKGTVPDRGTSRPKRIRNFWIARR